MSNVSTNFTTTKETLAKAYTLFIEARNPLSPEMLSIRTMFLSYQNILAFHDDTLYLSFLKNMISERLNLSFPEEPALYQQYFKDCIALKDLEQSLPGYSPDIYLADTIRLMENLKTPYYSVYFRTLYALKSIFSDSQIFSRTLQEFYGIMIKSTSRLLPFLAEIAEQGFCYKKELGLHQEELIQNLLLSTLAYFAPKGEHISRAVFSEYMAKDRAFFETFAANPHLTNASIPQILAERMIFMEGLADVPAPVSHSTQLVDSEFLNHYAYNMNARDYVTNPAIGREEEIQDLALILISPKKSPILIGEAGVGKTSIVEGLAYALKNDNVPSLLKNKKIYKLTTTSLLSGTKYVGEMEDRMKKLMDELALHPDVLLFIDEIHTIVGAGSTENSNNDISNMLKPYIDRGDIKLIGATTSAEYHRFIKYDQALSRRFYPILVEEPDQEMCLRILYETIPNVSRETYVRNPFSEKETMEILSVLLELSRPEHQPEDLKTHWPELPLSLLEMAFSYAALDSRTEISIHDFVHAVAHSNRLDKATKASAYESFAPFFHEAQ